MLLWNSESCQRKEEGKAKTRKPGGICTSSVFFWCSLASRRILRVLGRGGIERRSLFLAALLVLCACEGEPCRRRPRRAKRRTAVVRRRGRCSSASRSSPAPARSSTPTMAPPSTGNPPFRRSTSSPQPAMPPRRRRPPIPPAAPSLSSSSAGARASMDPRTAPRRWLSCPRRRKLLPQLMLAPTLARHPCFLPASPRASRVGVWWVPKHLRRRRRRLLRQMLHLPRRRAGRWAPLARSRSRRRQRQVMFLPAFSAGASCSNRARRHCWVWSYFNSGFRYTYIPVGTGTLVWAKGASELIIYSFIHFFYVALALWQQWQSVAVELWAWNGILWW